MTAARQQAIDAITQALVTHDRPGVVAYNDGSVRAVAVAVYEAAEPLIRADRREQDAQLRGAYHALYEAWENGATVEIDLPGYNGISYSDTLALDEASDAVSGLLRAQS